MSSVIDNIDQSVAAERAKAIRAAECVREIERKRVASGDYELRRIDDRTVIHIRKGDPTHERYLKPTKV